MTDPQGVGVGFVAAACIGRSTRSALLCTIEVGAPGDVDYHLLTLRLDMRRTDHDIGTIDPAGLFELSADLVCVCRRGRIVYLNPAGRQHLDAPADSVRTGALLESLVHRSDRPEIGRAHV